MSNLMPMMGEKTELSMSSLDLLAMVNEARKEAGENAIRRNDFHARVKDELDGENYEIFVVRNFNNTETEAFRLNRDQCVLVSMRESKAVRRKVLERLKSMEAQISFRVPQSLPEALRLAAEQAERLEQQQAQLAQAAPKVEFVDRYVEASGLQNISNVAKMLNCGPIKFSRLLESDGILYRSGGALVPRQELIDRGLFRLKTGEANGHSWMQTKVTPKGVGWLSQRYGTEVDGL